MKTTATLIIVAAVAATSPTLGYAIPVASHDLVAVYALPMALTSADNPSEIVEYEDTTDGLYELSISLIGVDADEDDAEASLG